MSRLVCRISHQKGYKQAALLVCPRDAEDSLHSHLPVPSVPFWGHLDRYPKSLIPIPYGRHISPASCSLTLVTCTDGAGGQCTCGPGPLYIRLQVRGFTQLTNHKRPATSQSCRSPGRLHSQPWGKVPVRPKPQGSRATQPYHRPHLRLPCCLCRHSIYPQWVLEL